MTKMQYVERMSGDFYLVVMMWAPSTVLHKHFGKLYMALFYVALNVCILTLSSKITVPMWPVPMTMQTLAVMLVSICSPFAVHSVASWLLIGAIGAPVFATSAAGIASFVGPTGGYLVGFLAASCAIRALSKTALTGFFVFIIAEITIFFCGLLWLYTFTHDVAGALVAGLFPFILGDFLKVLIACSVIATGLIKRK